jgi:hypothetical protein
MAGRPKKRPDEARANVLRVRLREDERRALDEAARTRSLETSTWARSELLALAKRLLQGKK